MQLKEFPYISVLSRCKSYEKAKKKMTVSEAPNVLTIALKRFQVFVTFKDKILSPMLYEDFNICCVIPVWKIWEAQ